MVTNVASHSSTAGGGFDDNVCEVGEKAISQSESEQPARQSVTRPQEDANTWTCPPIVLYLVHEVTEEAQHEAGSGRSLKSNCMRRSERCITLVGHSIKPLHRLNIFAVE